MNSSRSLMSLVAIAGLLTTAAGGKGGSVGSTNGLTPEMYHKNKYIITDLMMHSLPPTLAAATTSAQSLLLHAGESGPQQVHRLISDTIGCALPFGVTLQYGNQASFSGAGLLTSTQGWLTGPLNESQQNDIHTCLIARLNKFGVEVPILLVGDNVRQAPDVSVGIYPYAEAVWLASGAGRSSTIDVWPLDTLSASCNLNIFALTAAITQRVCDKPGECGVSVHFTSNPSDPAKCVQSLAGTWTCNTPKDTTYRPAIATKLGPCAWQAIYGHPQGRDKTCQLPRGIDRKKHCDLKDP